MTNEEKAKIERFDKWTICMADVVIRPKIKPATEIAHCPHCNGKLVLFNRTK